MNKYEIQILKSKIAFQRQKVNHSEKILQILVGQLADDVQFKAFTIYQAPTINPSDFERPIINTAAPQMAKVLFPDHNDSTTIKSGSVTDFHLSEHIKEINKRSKKINYAQECRDQRYLETGSMGQGAIASSDSDSELSVGQELGEHDSEDDIKSNHNSENNYYCGECADCK